MYSFQYCLFPDCRFKQLKKLDLSHAIVHSISGLIKFDYALPPTLETLILDDVSGLQTAAFASAQENLIYLSMSHNYQSTSQLQDVFKRLQYLQSLFLRGKNWQIT